MRREGRQVRWNFQSFELAKALDMGGSGSERARDLEVYETKAIKLQTKLDLRGCADSIFLHETVVIEHITRKKGEELGYVYFTLCEPHTLILSRHLPRHL